MNHVINLRTILSMQPGRENIHMLAHTLTCTQTCTCTHSYTHTSFFLSKWLLPFLKFWVQQFLLLLSYFLSLKLFPCVYSVLRTFTRCARAILATLSLETTPHSLLLPGLYSCVSILFLSTSLPLCTASSPSTWTSPFRMPSAASDIKRSSCHPSLSPLFPLL